MRILGSQIGESQQKLLGKNVQQYYTLTFLLQRLFSNVFRNPHRWNVFAFPEHKHVRAGIKNTGIHQMQEGKHVVYKLHMCFYNINSLSTLDELHFETWPIPPQSEKSKIVCHLLIWLQKLNWPAMLTSKTKTKIVFLRTGLSNDFIRVFVWGFRLASLFPDRSVSVYVRHVCCRYLWTSGNKQSII